MINKVHTTLPINKFTLQFPSVLDICSLHSRDENFPGRLLLSPCHSIVCLLSKSLNCNITRTCFFRRMASWSYRNVNLREVEWANEKNPQTLNLVGKDLSSFTRMHSPIKVAREQWGIVGVKLIIISLCLSSTVINLCCVTLSCSNVSGCSGSLMFRIKSPQSVTV